MPRGIADGQRVHRPRDHRDHRIGDIVLDEQHPQGRAALARALEGRGDDVAGDLLGQGRAVDDHRILAAGFGDERDDRPVALGQRAVDHARGPGRAGEDDAREQRMRGQRSADDAARAGRELDDMLGNARLVHQLDRERADQRRLPGRLGDHRIARGERRRHQAGEDRQREIPRRNGGEHPAAVEAQLVPLAGRPGQRASAR